MPPSPINLAFKTGVWQNETVTFRIGYLIIKINTDGLSDPEIENELIQVLDTVVHNTDIFCRIGGWAYVRVPVTADIPDVAEKLAQKPKVIYAEPDLAMTAALEVNDPWESIPGGYQQWGLKTMLVEEAWDLTQGTEDVVIGLLDGGVPLKAGWEGSLALADSLEGWIDHEDLNGARFLCGNNYTYDPLVPGPHDIDGHGTSMAGIIAAEQNNCKGLAGINWVSPVYTCRVLTDEGKSSAAFAYLGAREVMDYAAANNKRVVLNVSLNFEDDVSGIDVYTFEDMCVDLIDADGIMVCAAGNGGVAVQFPAAAAASSDLSDNIVSVGATEEDDTMWSNTNFSGSGDMEITVAAPGKSIGTTAAGGGYTEGSGTSEAAAQVTGVISLMWSLNPELSAAQIIAALQRSAEIPEVHYTSEHKLDPPEKWYGYGLVNASRALDFVDWGVTLLTNSISFENVPAGDEPSETIQIEITGGLDVTFTVTVAGDDFGITDGTRLHNPEDGSIWEELTAVYYSTLPSPASCDVTITWDDKPGEPPMVVHIEANRVAAGKPVILVTADKSGSMGRDSGIMEYTRMDVLSFSSGVLIDRVEPGGAVGVVSFDEEAHPGAGVTLIDPADPVPARDFLKTAIDDLEAGGNTSVAAGILQAKAELDAVPADLVEGDDKKAIIVLSDGRENRDPYVADILTEEFTYPVYAIGMGEAGTLDADDLIALTNTTLGYTTITGALDDDSEYVIGKYYDQILAELYGEELEYDPTQRLLPGTHEFKLNVTRSDRYFDVILLRQADAPLEVRIFAPSGEMVPGSNVGIRRGARVTGYRVMLPLGTDAGPMHRGTWRVRVDLQRGAFEDFLDALEGEDLDVSTARRHGLRYCLSVHVKSSVRMRARIYQDGYEPGSSMTVRARLTHYDLPLPESSVGVQAFITHPDGAEDSIKLLPTAPGVFEGRYPMSMPGVYVTRVLAAGRSLRGDRFRREFQLTGAVHS